MGKQVKLNKKPDFPPVKPSPLAVALVMALTRPAQDSLAAGTTAEIDLPPATAPPLTRTQVQAPPQESLAEVQTTAPEPAPVASGTITWKWLLYPVTPTVLGISVGQRMPGYQFVALGVTIVNRSTIPVDVDNNAFTVTIDGRTYSSEVWSTGHAMIQGMAFLAPAKLEPGGEMSGFTGYMIPQQFRRGQPQLLRPLTNKPNLPTGPAYGQAR